MTGPIPKQVVTIDYTNWRGERATRRIHVVEFRFGRTDLHPDPQWLFDAVDLDRGVVRTFALGGVHSWRANDVASARDDRDYEHG